MEPQSVDAAIRVARPREYGQLREIETASEELFAQVGMGPFWDDGENHLEHAAVVFASGDPAVGFACVEVVDGAAHLRQLSVHPSESRRGRGSALVSTVCDWARSEGFGAVTLTTFRDVPWNAPFYARMGFRVLGDLTLGLQAIRDHERAIGDDDLGPRVAMRRDLGPAI